LVCGVVPVSPLLLLAPDGTTDARAVMTDTRARSQPRAAGDLQDQVSAANVIVVERERERERTRRERERERVCVLQAGQAQGRHRASWVESVNSFDPVVF